MPTVPAVKCPRCGIAADYQITIEMIDPPVGKIDVGHCASCACLFEYIRETGTSYESTSWPPVCRKCRQPVSFAAVTGPDADPTVHFHCRDHHSERWNWQRGADRWTRAG
jgi:hypothetical protein